MTTVGRERRLATATWDALGTTALVRVDDPDALEDARAAVDAELEAIDLAASRFREDSELERINRSPGRMVGISALLHEAIAAALDAAAITGGAVDPTLGEAIRLAGYDRDWRELDHGADCNERERLGVNAGPERLGVDAHPERLRVTAGRAGGWRQVTLIDDPPGVVVPPGMRLDLGATAKALAADRAAAAATRATGAGVLVSLGGDIATAGRVPPGGWQIHVTDDHRSSSSAPGQTVAIAGGALATSSTTARRWRRGGEEMHHILDPHTRLPAVGPWRTVSVTAATCVDANTASTAAIVLGHRAPEWLADHGLAARLVGANGEIERVGGWPS